MVSSKELVARAMEFIEVYTQADGEVEPTTQQEYDLARGLRELRYHGLGSKTAEEDTN